MNLHSVPQPEQRQRATNEALDPQLLALEEFQSPNRKSLVETRRFSAFAVRNLRLSLALGCGCLLFFAKPAFAQQTNLSRPDFSKFSLVTTRNIFDPNRFGYSSPNRPSRYVRYDALMLVGTMSYEKGPYAFFDGTSSDYRKVVQDSDSVGGFKVASIEPSVVKLTSPSNQFDLRVGMELRKEPGGSWHPVAQDLAPLSPPPGGEPFHETASQNGTNAVAINGEPPTDMTNFDPAAPPGPPTDAMTNGAPEAPPAAGETDPVLLRLMQRRQQENQ